MSAIRSFRQVAAASTRASASRSTSSALTRTRSLLLLSASRSPSICVRSASRAFSVSARASGEAASDAALAQKLGEELKYEKEAEEEAVGESEPEFLKTFKAQNIWQVDDKPGNDEVTLTRKFGSETIRLVFSIADIQTPEEFDEEEESEQEGQEEEEQINTYPVRCSFSITKDSGPGALNIDAICEEGNFVVHNVSYYSDAKVATEFSAEMDWKRRGLYIGPQFDTLDVVVQEAFEQFLQERGINESLALFIPEYSELKEQKEYVKWLGNVKSFVEL